MCVTLQLRTLELIGPMVPTGEANGQDEEGAFGSGCDRRSCHVFGKRGFGNAGEQCGRYRNEFGRYPTGPLGLASPSRLASRLGLASPRLASRMASPSVVSVISN